MKGQNTGSETSLPLSKGGEDEDMLQNANRARIPIPGDTVKVELGKLREAGKISEADEAAVWWLYSYAKDHKWSLADAAEAIGYDTSTVHRLFNGTYGAKLDKVVEAILRFRKVAIERAKRKDIGYIETSTWRKVSAICDSAFYDALPAFIYGASQIGKTEALEEYTRRNNHGQTRYLRMPAAPTFTYFVKILAEACYISHRQQHDVMRQRIMNVLDKRNLLIVDEVHLAIITATDITSKKVMEFLREVYDRTKCGIVLCGTKVFRDEFERGRLNTVFDQFRRRGMLELQLPDAPPKSDIVKIAASFELAPPDEATLEIIQAMLKESGIGKYIKFLQYAHGVSVSRKEKLGWGHFTDAYEGVRQLSSK
jgi:DNA transposition AAA+ family ATPase